MTWGLLSKSTKSMGPSCSDRENNILEAEGAKTRLMFFCHHFTFLLVLWILLDLQWRAGGAELIVASELNISIAQLIDALQLNVSRVQLINESMLNVTLPPGVDLNNQGKTVKNFNVPLPVYVCVPLLTVAISACVIYGFCWWRMKLVRRRKTIMEKQNQRRRRSSLKPGSSERGKKFGLTRAIGPDGDPLIIPTVKALSLARKVDDVEQLVLDYTSFDMGDHLPEKQEYMVKEEAYYISINPLFNSLQSGACGYVIGGDDKAATSPPGPKKPEEGTDNDSDSDDSPKKKTSKKLSKLESTTALLRLSRLRAESKSKEDLLRQSLATKSLVKEVRKESEETKDEESAEESTYDASSDGSSVESEASSVESLDTRSESGATSEEEADDESINRPDSPRSPTVSRFSKVTSASDGLTKISSSPEPEAKEESPSTSVSREASATPMASEAAVSAEDSPGAESEAESGEESSTASPSTRSVDSSEESTRVSSSSKFSKTADSDQDTPRVSLSSKSSKAPDEESPRVNLSPTSAKASPSTPESPTPRAMEAAQSGGGSPSADSYKVSSPSSSAPRASQATFPRENAPLTSLSPSTSKAASPSPRARPTPRAMEAAQSADGLLSADSGKVSSPSSSAPRASQATVRVEKAPPTSLSPSPSKAAAPGRESKSTSPVNSAAKGKRPVSPIFSNVTTSDNERKESTKKSSWDPSTVPERSSIRRTVIRSQGASPYEPSSPKVSGSTEKAPHNNSETASPEKTSVNKAGAQLESSKKSPVSKR